jgi:hypothetical protein
MTTEGFGRSRRLSAAIGATGSSSESPYQSYILKRGAGEIMKPSWEQPTIFRILPGLNPDNPSEFDPWRFSTRVDEYGQWFYPIDVAAVSCEANNRTSRTWVIRDPFDKAYNLSNNPLVLMRNAVKSAISQKQPFAINWLSLINGGQGRGPELAAPKESWLVQAVVMEHGGKTFEIPKGFGPDDRTVFLVLTISAVQAIKRAMDQRKPDFAGDPEDIAGHYLYGDPVSLDDGAYIVLFNREKDPRTQNIRPGGQSAFSSAAQRGGAMEVKGYDAFLQKEYRGGGAQLTEFQQLVMDKVKVWQDSVNIPTDEEQVKLLEQVYRPFSDLLVYSLDDTHGEFLDQKIRREGLVKLGRMRPVDHTPIAESVPVQAPPAPRAEVRSVPQPATPSSGSPFARAAAASRSSEAPENPTSTRGIDATPEPAPVVRNSLGNQDDAAIAMEAVARARREAMRGSSVPRPTSAN